MAGKSNLKFNLDIQFFAGTLDRTKIVSKIQTDSSNVFDIVPNKIANDTGNYYAELPTLTKNETIATGTQLATKQDTLVSGTNIKTINGQNILGSGNVTIEAGVSSVNGKTGAVTLAKGDIGLGNVDNTSDANKPISTAMQTALDAKLDKKPDGTNDLIDSSVNKVNEIYIPDYILGQLVYGGLVNASTGVATLSNSAKSKLGITSDTVTLTPSAYATYENIYFVVNTAGTFASIAFKVGDWLIATGSAWGKVDNTDEVTSVNGKTGAVTLSMGDLANDRYVRYDTNAQGLTSAQKGNVRTNIDALSTTGTANASYKIAKRFYKSSEAETATGYYKIATITHSNWAYCAFTMLCNNSYSGDKFNTLFDVRCSDSANSLNGFAFNIIGGTDISNKLTYLETKSGDNITKIEIFMQCSRYEHPEFFLIAVHDSSILDLNSVDWGATPDKPNDTAMTGNATNTIVASNALKLNGQDPAYYLNYNNLTNKPIFWAIYGTTTGEEIAAAINAGQDVRVKYGTNIYGNPMLHNGEGRYYFSGLYGSYTRLVVTCSSTGKTWTSDSKAFLGGFQVDGTSRVIGANNGYVNTINGDYDPTTNKLATASDIPTKTSQLTNDSNYVSDASYVHTDNNYTTAEKNKLAGIASGAEVNVQSDWNVTDSSSDAFIKNKPTIPTVNNGTLTIQKNGTNVQTFTANQSNNVTANITVPTTLDDIGDGSTRKLSDYVTLNGDNTGSGNLAYESNVVRDGVTYKVGSYLASDTFLGAYEKNLSTNAQYGLNIQATGFIYNDSEGDGHICGLTFGNSGTIAVTGDIPTKVSELENDRYVRYDTNSQGLTSTQKTNARTNIGAGTSNLALGTSSTTAASGDHTYHYWTNNAYYYDSYSGEKNWRIITENVLGDTLRWQASTVANEEYWDYDSSSWKTSSLDFSNLFDGNSGSSVSIPYAQRKFRFTMTASSGWPTTTLICLEGSWFNSGTISKITGTDYYVILTIETRANASADWVVKTTANFTQTCMNKLAFCTSVLHTGDILYRFTIELAPWSNTTSIPNLKRLMILTNYSGNTLTPFTYNGTGKVTARNTLNATTLQEGGTNLESKYLGISAKANDSDKLDGHDSTYFQKALPTTTTAGKVLKSTSTAGTVEWGDDANTTYTIASGDSNGQIKVTPSSGDAYNVNVKGLGSAAYKSTGTASGNVPVLDSNGKLDSSVLPAIAVSETFTASSQAAMLALDAQVGDICVRTDESKTYILVKTPASTLANWKLLEHPADAVSSVNGKTGVVTLKTDDISDANQAHKFVIELEDNSTTTAGTWLAKTNAITSLEDGQMFLYKIAVAGASTTTLNITANGTALGAKTIYRVGTTKLTTQYPVGHYLLLVYNSLNTCFRVVNDSDANSYAYVRQYQYGSNAAGSGTKYPLLARYNLTNKSGTYDTAYTKFHTDVTVDTSDGALYANAVYANGEIVATASQLDDKANKASMTAGTYSSVTVNSQGIVTAGGQVLEVIEHGATPTVATGGWYFEKDA